MGSDAAIKLLVCAWSIADGVPTREAGCIPALNSLIALDLKFTAEGSSDLDRYVLGDSRLAVPMTAKAARKICELNVLKSAR
jgi:hypothetical protein